jgi:hypothetical protein
MDVIDLEYTGRFFPSLEADARSWLRRVGFKRYRRAVGLTVRQTKSLRAAWIRAGANTTVFDTVIFVQRWLSPFEYMRDPARGKIPLRGSKTFKLMRGDCKDFAVLAASLLKALGLTPYLELRARGDGHCNHMCCHEPITEITLGRSSDYDDSTRARVFACVQFRIDADG